MPPRTITLTEYTPLRLPAEALTTAEGERLWRDYGAQVQVAFPSPQSNYEWILTAQGWVGHVPLAADLTLHLLPRVPLANLFHMVAYAYGLPQIRWLPGVVQASTVADFWGALAQLLAEGVLARVQQGVVRAYVPQDGWYTAVRGRINYAQLAARPWAGRAAVPCTPTQHTADIPHNQLLAATLRHLATSPLCTPAVQTVVRRAYHALPPLAERPWTTAEIAALPYDRLTEDYRPLHALCQLFWAASSPSTAEGEQIMRPFLLNMAHLFEQFVAAWLRAHLPAGYGVQVQRPLPLGGWHITPDIVVADGAGRPLVVLDTKYKTPTQPAPEDIYQVAFYASNALQCAEAVLVYPLPLARPLDEQYQQVHIRTLTFDLGQETAVAGGAFLGELLGELGSGRLG